MQFINTVELKNHLNAVLAQVSHGEAVIVTLRGKPAATLLPTTEKDIDQILFEQSAFIRKAVQEGLRDLNAGRSITLKNYVARRFGKLPPRIRR